MAERQNQTFVADLKVTGERYQIRDIVILGLVIRVEATGNKIFLLDYYRPGSKKRTTLKLGSVKLLTVAQAREAAKEFLANVTLGADPGENRRQVGRETLGTFIRDCYAPWVEENRKSGVGTVKLIFSTFAPFRDSRITDLTPLNSRTVENEGSPREESEGLHGEPERYRPQGRVELGGEARDHPRKPRKGAGASTRV